MFHTGEIAVDLVRRVVTVGGNTVKLSPKEYDLLTQLVIHAGKVLTHNHLFREVWDIPYTGDPQYLRVYIRQLRRKLEVDPDRPRYIVTESGVGYRLEIDPEPSLVRGCAPAPAPLQAPDQAGSPVGHDGSCQSAICITF